MGKKAVIENNKVINIIEYGDHGIDGIRLPLDQILWDCTNVPIIIGDDFKDGIFTRNGEPVEPIPSAEQRIAELESTIDILTGGDGTNG